MIDIAYAKAIIKEKLSPQRYIHSLNVAKEAQDLAAQYGEDGGRAYLAGILHDYAKGLSADTLIAIAKEYHVIENEIEYSIPDILHARVGAILLERDNIITDSRILNAIGSHTLGNAHMNDLDKIIFLADMIEPGRDYPQHQRLHCLAYKNLDEAILFGLELTIRYCLENRRLLHPKTVEVRNIYLKMCK